MIIGALLWLRIHYTNFALCKYITRSGSRGEGGMLISVYTLIKIKGISMNVEQDRIPEAMQPTGHQVRPPSKRYPFNRVACALQNTTLLSMANSRGQGRNKGPCVKSKDIETIRSYYIWRKIQKFYAKILYQGLHLVLVIIKYLVYCAGF